MTSQMDPATRADLCALLIDEMKVEELVEKHVDKTYDTGFRPPGADRDIAVLRKRLCKFGVHQARWLCAAVN